LRRLLSRSSATPGKSQVRYHESTGHATAPGILGLHQAAQLWQLRARALRSASPEARARPIPATFDVETTTEPGRRPSDRRPDSLVHPQPPTPPPTVLRKPYAIRLQSHSSGP
jgi:hypothetical protein